MVLLGMRTSIINTAKFLFTLYNNKYNFLIPIRGRCRVGAGVDVN